MKKTNLLISLMVLASTMVGCESANNNSSQNSPVSSSSIVEPSNEDSSSITAGPSEEQSSSTTDEPSNDTSSSDENNDVPSSSTTDEPSADPAPVEAELLKDLKLGFAARSALAKSYDGGTPSITLIETYVGDGVAKWKKFSGSSWDAVAANATPTSMAQYESFAVDFDGESIDMAKIVTRDPAGNPIYNPMMLKDSVSGKDVEAFWEETKLVNAFSLFDEEDFVKVDDTTYSLDFSATKLADTSYADAVEGLGRQMFMELSGYSTHTFIEQSLTSYTLTVDENKVPVSYAASFENYDSYGSTVSQTITGDFIGLGANQVTKITPAEAKYPELDAVFTKLQAQEYEFNIHRKEAGDGWYSYGSDQYITGKADGKGNFVVSSQTDAANWSGAITTTFNNFGYIQNEDGTYRKYIEQDGVKVWNGNAVSGSTLTDVLPQFKFSSAYFQKNEYSTDGLDVYRYIVPELLDSSYTTDADLIDFGFDNIQGWTLKDLVVLVRPSSVKFIYFTSNTREVIATFSNFGGVSDITVSATEPASLLAGTYEDTLTIKGVEVALKFEFAADGSVVVSKNGEAFGTYTYSIDAKQNIIIDESILTNIFTIVGTDEATYSVYINNQFEIDDLFAPNNLEFRCYYQKEGASSASSSWGDAVRVVESES